LQQEILKIRNLIFARLLVTSVLLASYLFFGQKAPTFHYNVRLSYLAAFSFFLSVVYLLVLKRLTSRFHLFVYVQVVIDVFVILFLVVITGGMDSWFSFLLLINVIGAGIMLGRQPVVVVASISSIAYGAVIELQYYGVLGVAYNELLQAEDFLHNIFANMTAIFLVAYLVRHLVINVEKTSHSLKKTQSDYSKLHAFHSEIIENIPTGLLYTDPAGVVRLFNRSAEAITGISRYEVEGMAIRDLFAFAPAEMNAGRFKGIKTVSGADRIIELSISEHLEDAGPAVTSKGGHIPASSNRTPNDAGGGAATASNSGAATASSSGAATASSSGAATASSSGTPGLLGYVVIFEDLTKITAMERDMKEREKLAAIGELSANIAHEIRNPLAALRTSVEMLRERGRRSAATASNSSAATASSSPSHSDGAREERIMEIALHEMDRLNKIITDFLVYCNPRPPEFKRVVLNTLIAETLDMLAHSLPDGGGVVITRSLDQSVVLRADPDKLRQVFWNLGLNAMQAMSGGGSLDVSLKRAGDFAKITFRDTGCGIDGDNVARIFYPFFTTKKDGTGLGLAMVYRIVNEHGGEIGVQSVAGAGTTFEITIPGVLHDKF
jgi:signal transduction histidine kinase/PAS domain-containing protein